MLNNSDNQFVKQLCWGRPDGFHQTFNYAEFKLSDNEIINKVKLYNKVCFNLILVLSGLDY